MKAEEVMSLADMHAGLLSDRAYGYVVSDDEIERSEAVFRAAVDRLTQAEALLAEMAHNRDAGYHFSSDSDWSTCPFCGYVTFLEGDRGHMEDCPITRARELLGIEV